MPSAKETQKCLVCDKTLRKIKENELYEWTGNRTHKKCYKTYNYMESMFPGFYDKTSVLFF